MLRKSKLLVVTLLLLPVFLFAQKSKPKSKPKSKVKTNYNYSPISVENNRGQNSITFKSLGTETFLDFVISDEFGRIIFFGENFRNGSSLSLALFQRGTYSIYFAGASLAGRNHQFTVGRDF